MPVVFFIRIVLLPVLLSALTDKDDNLNFMKFAGNGIDTSELLAFCNEMPFFADRRVVLVENSGLFKSSNEDFAKKLVEIEDTSVGISCSRVWTRMERLWILRPLMRR